MRWSLDRSLCSLLRSLTNIIITIQKEDWPRDIRGSDASQISIIYSGDLTINCRHYIFRNKVDFYLYFSSTCLLSRNDKFLLNHVYYINLAALRGFSYQWHSLTNLIFQMKQKIRNNQNIGNILAGNRISWRSVCKSNKQTNTLLYNLYI